MASCLPFFLLLLCFVKKETVSGTIGNTQGVSNANNPPKNPRKKIFSNPFSSLLLPVPQSCTGLLMSRPGISILLVEVFPPSSAISNSAVSPGKKESALPYE